MRSRLSLMFCHYKRSQQVIFLVPLPNNIKRSQGKEESMKSRWFLLLDGKNTKMMNRVITVKTKLLF